MKIENKLRDQRCIKPIKNYKEKNKKNTKLYCCTGQFYLLLL